MCADSSVSHLVLPLPSTWLLLKHISRIFACIPEGLVTTTTFIYLLRSACLIAVGLFWAAAACCGCLRLFTAAAAAVRPHKTFRCVCTRCTTSLNIQLFSHLKTRRRFFLFSRRSFHFFFIFSEPISPTITPGAELVARSVELGGGSNNLGARRASGDALSIKCYRSRLQPQIKSACLFVCLASHLTPARLSSPSVIRRPPLWRRLSSRLIGSDGPSGEFVGRGDAALARRVQYGAKKRHVGLMKS